MENFVWGFHGLHMPKCIKMHICASLFSKKFPGVTPGPSREGRSKGMGGSSLISQSLT